MAAIAQLVGHFRIRIHDLKLAEHRNDWPQGPSVRRVVQMLARKPHGHIRHEMNGTKRFAAKCIAGLREIVANPKLKQGHKTTNRLELG